MLVGFLTFAFVVLCLFLGLFILIQQGKGDMGLGSLGGSTQMLFDGSGGQEFFVKTTWILGSFFIFGSLGLAILKSREINRSRLEGFVMKKAEQEIADNLVKDGATTSDAPSAESGASSTAESNEPAAG